MPRLKNAIPKYRKHKQSGQAIVTLNGRDHLLGPHGTKASKLEYDRLIGEWLQAGRQLRPDGNNDEGGFTIIELIVAYLAFAKGYYRKDGRLTGEYESLRHAARPVKLLYGRKPCSEFGPIALQSVMHKMIDSGLARGTINRQVGRIKRMFRWGVSQELIPAYISQALESVSGLRKGRTTARETGAVQPVADAVVDATVERLPDVPADMVKFQRLTGCRPAELCLMRPCDIDQSDDPWWYVPESHKTEHHGRERRIPIGPKAQEILLRYLARDAAAYCFQPRDSEAKRRAAVHAARRVPASCGNVPGSNRVRYKRRRAPGGRYTVDSYRRAIHRACDKAFPAPKDIADDPAKLAEWQGRHRWAPNQLRHSAATEIRKRFGLEAAQVTLGHSKADVTQVYAERDYALAATVARQIG